MLQKFYHISACRTCPGVPINISAAACRKDPSMKSTDYGGDVNLGKACFSSHEAILRCVSWKELYFYWKLNNRDIPTARRPGHYRWRDHCRPVVPGQQGYGFFYQDACINANVKRLHFPDGLKKCKEFKVQADEIAKNSTRACHMTNEASPAASQT